ncbi:calpain-8-like [Anomaloglossus baeobatrachus]|uniref:calpain-8-like n=1 Tax=Anomaloglossus baeobatrachus TaxID=238106 RepID=UPI003F50C69A
MSGVAAKIAQDRAKAAGLGSFKNPIKFLGQDYEKLKAECLASKKPFVDEEFKADQSSLGKEKAGLGPESEIVKGTDKNPAVPIEWKRPTEITGKPVFIVGGTESDDACQGGVGDCWFLSSIACLTTNKDFLSNVVPLDQSFDKDYAGIFRFKFWQYGQWVEVVIDDRLPTRNNKLLFAKSKTSDEFWTPLLEKAYAKIIGSYESLGGGYIMDPLEDFTGGVAEGIVTNNAPQDLFQMIQMAIIQKSLVGCLSRSKVPNESEFSNSIGRGHVYSISRAEEVTYGENKEHLIRLRNPWGHGEWTGAWNDKSEDWNKLDPDRRKELNPERDDGEFWMPFSEFVKEYYQVEICDISMSEVCAGDNYRWCLTEFNGSWKKGSTSGGKNSEETFWMNPQYRITLEGPDGDTSKKCPIVVSLIQKDRKKLKYQYKAYIRPGFYIYKVNPLDKLPLEKEFFANNTCAESLTTFLRYRETAKRFELLPGNYVIVAATNNPEEEADFYLRVFTEKPAGAQEPGNSMPPDVFQPGITPEKDSEFDIVKDELQKGEFYENDVKDMLNKMLSKYPELQSKGLAIKTIRDLIKLMDEDNTKTLSIDEFKKTWLKVDNCRRIFQSVNTDKRETLEPTEFRNAMIQAGFNFNITILNAVVDRLVHDNLTPDFNGFISIAVHLETVYNMYNLLNPDQGGSITLSLDEWLLAKLA